MSDKKKLREFFVVVHKTTDEVSWIRTSPTNIEIDENREEIKLIPYQDFENLKNQFGIQMKLGRDLLKNYETVCKERDELKAYVHRHETTSCDKFLIEERDKLRAELEESKSVYKQSVMVWDEHMGLLKAELETRKWTVYEAVKKERDELSRMKPEILARLEELLNKEYFQDDADLMDRLQVDMKWVMQTLRRELEVNAVLEEGLRTIRQESDSGWEIGVSMEALAKAQEIRKKK